MEFHLRDWLCRWQWHFPDHYLDCGIKSLDRLRQGTKYRFYHLWPPQTWKKLARSHSRFRSQKRLL
jgi:hypothetical protein